MYYSAIGVLAALVLVIVNRDVLSNQEVYDKPAWIVYRKFLFAVLVYYVTDILWGLLEYKKLASALFFDTTVYFMAMALGISFWAEYTVAYLNEKSTFGRFLVHTGRAVVGLVIGMAAVNIFKPVLFTVDESSVYKALPIRYALLVCQIVFLIIISLHALTSMFKAGSDSEMNTRYRILASFGIIMASCLFAQLWFPYMPLYSIAYMLGTCLLHSFVANDENEEHKRKLEEAKKIAELKDRFFSLLNNMPGMTFTKDAETGKYLACNQAFAVYAHKDSPEGVVGLTDAQIFDAETAEHFTQDDKIALSMSKPYIFYEDVTDAMGNPRQLQTTKIRYKDTNGRPCVLGMCQDITDLVSIQHEQSMTKEAYESAVNTGLMYNHIAQTLARDYTEMFYVNTDSEEFTEYHKGEEDGTLSEIRHGWHFFSDCKAELSERVYSDDKEEFLEAMNRKKLMKNLSSRDTFVMTFRQVAQDKPVYFSMKISRMVNDEHFIIIGFTDVDAEMREAIAKNKALSDALSSAEAANRSMTTFLSGMSHDIRTPINAIIGLDSLALKNDGLDAKTREYFEEIGNSAGNLLSIINDILDMSLIESGRVVLHDCEFSLVTILEQICRTVKPQCSKEGIAFETNFPEQKGDTYIGDDIKLKMLLKKILSNSVRSAGKNGRITFTAEKTDERDDRASFCFTVSDTGYYPEKVREPNLPEGTDKRTESVSSGLSRTMAQKIVKLMGGTISVEHNKDAGNKITVLLTLKKGSSTVPEHSGEIDPHEMFILVVDDNPIEAEHAKMVLEEVGIQAECCTNGQEALRRMKVQHAQKKPYNIVLMDWNMPEMNGMETSAEIIRLYDNECIVVAMTTYSWDDIREEAKSIGVEDYFEKPLFAANVMSSLERIAHRSNLSIFKEKSRARLSGRRILMAEDMPINAEIMTDMLELENIKVDNAENGKEAVEMFGKSTEGIYSAILMDVRMPVMDGLEAAKTIRAMKRDDAKRIPIIALTANSFDEDVQLSIQAGMNAHLSKPVEADHLLRILGELIYDAESSMTGKMY